jgi:hypothetical protein
MMPSMENQPGPKRRMMTAVAKKGEGGVVQEDVLVVPDAAEQLVRGKIVVG